MKLEVNTTSVTQTSNAVLGTPEKTLYYLIIGEDETKLVVNIGQKTYDSIMKLVNEEPKKLAVEDAVKEVLKNKTVGEVTTTKVK